MTLPVPPASGLKFSHASHLIAEGKRRPEGGRQKLGCVDCHQSANAGRDMTLPSFEQGCQSCHTLAFAAEDPTRRLPHGSVWEVQAEVDEFYAAVEAGDIKVTPLAAPERRRRPGARPRAIVKPAPLPAAARAEAALSGPAVKGQCQTCHVLDEGTNAAEWDIVPVDAIHDWLSSARFDHGDHEGEASCSSCHAVATSQSVEDVAMPSIGTCLECHGSASDFPDVDSTCASCHGFHGEPEQGASLEGHNGFATATTDTTPLARLAEILSDGKN
jgi:predicted CXXCH cytochrome family protein